MTTAIRKTDTDLRDDVIRELAWDPRVQEKQIAVQAASGVVTLAGTVESWAARNAAVEAAHRVAGVLDVANELEVMPTRRSAITDAEIAQAARQALEWDALAPDEQVHVTVSHGRITLSGTVDTLTERNEAERAVERLRGVRHVSNEMQVRHSLAPDDVKGAIEAALARHAARETAHLHLTADDGHVVVEGTVGSTAERRAVLGTIHGTRGVTSVDDRLVVSPAAHG